jgi:predicted SnoaL-like aldol condensation-catalyzing enzyme
MKKVTTVVALLLALSSQVTFAQKSKEIQDEKNKKIVVTFYQRLFGDKDITAIDEYLAENYIQHNPGVADGRQALKDIAVKWLANQPKSKVDFQKIVADGDLVVLHIKTKSFTSVRDASLIDIFRVKDGKIVEHWDIMQEVPEKSANTHPMF